MCLHPFSIIALRDNPHTQYSYSTNPIYEFKFRMRLNVSRNVSMFILYQIQHKVRPTNQVNYTGKNTR